MKNKKYFIIVVLIQILSLTGCSISIFNSNDDTTDTNNEVIGNIDNTLKAFPSAEGFGMSTTGGRGGDVVYVTNLNHSGPGSLNEALGYHASDGNKMIKPRYILFKISGIVSNGTYLWDHITHIEYGDFTLAGQTSPGGIIVGGLMNMKKKQEDYDNGTLHLNNIIIRHIRSRPTGTANPLDDCIRLVESQNVIIDHCSFAWATDEAMQIAKNKNFTVQNSIFAETLGEHYNRGGILIKYGNPDFPNTNITFHHNAITRIGGRMPQVGVDSKQAGMGMNLEISNNLLWDPGSTMNIITGTYISNFSTEHQKIIDFWCHANMINNFMFTLDVEEKEDYWKSCGVFQVKHPESQIYSKNNNINIFPEINDKVRISKDYVTVLESRLDFPIVNYTPTEDLIDYMVYNVGAFPRDPMDKRLIKDFENRTIIKTKCNEKGADDGFTFNWTSTPIPPLDSDDDGMPDEWELHNGLDPLAKDHNGKELSVKYYGVKGYDNIEVYLNRLSDNLVNGTPIIVGSPNIYPVSIKNVLFNDNISKEDVLHISVDTGKVDTKSVKISLTHLENPFSFPSSPPVEAEIENGVFNYNYTIHKDIMPGTYQVLIEIKDNTGNRGFKIINITIV